MQHVTNAPVPPTPASDADSALQDVEPAAATHDEWLLDESLSETFPASDPIAPAFAERLLRHPR